MRTGFSSSTWSIRMRSVAGIPCYLTRRLIKRLSPDTTRLWYSQRTLRYYYKCDIYIYAWITFLFLSFFYYSILLYTAADKARLTLDHIGPDADFLAVHSELHGRELQNTHYAGWGGDRRHGLRHHAVEVFQHPIMVELTICRVLTIQQRARFARVIFVFENVLINKLSLKRNE